MSEFPGNAKIDRNRGGNKLPDQTDEIGAPREKKLSFEQKLKIAAIIIALVSFAGCSALMIREFISLDQKVKKQPAQGKKLNGYVRERAAAPVNLVRFLPPSIEGFNTQAHHKVPGEEKFAAEAIYETDKEDIFAKHNSYVKITFYEDPRDAVKEISENLKIRYPEEMVVVTRNGIKVHTGYEEGYGGYYLAYIADQYLIEIHTNFLAATPKDRGTLLEDSAWGVFDSVSKQVTDVLGH